MFVAHQRLSEVKIIVDVNRNDFRALERLSLESMDNKLKAFNFECERISGHDYESILTGLDFLLNASKIPRVLIADTIKGKDVSFMEDRAHSHYWGQLSKEQMRRMLEDLKP